MSKIKKCILTIIFAMLALILFMQNKTYAYSIGDTIQISENSMSASDSIYCVAYSKQFGGIKGMDYKVTFKVMAYVEIEGNKAIGVSTSGQTISMENDSNSIMAAILGGPLKRGYGSYEKYNDAQKALYAYWNTWVGSVGASYGFSSDTANDSVSGGTTALNKAIDAAAKAKESGIEYKATIYLLKATGDDFSTNVQELIAVDALPPSTPSEPDNPNIESGQTTVKGTINISGYVWEDISNTKNNKVDSKYGDGDIKLSGIKVHWIGADGSEIASTETGADGSYKLSTDIDLYNHPYSIKDKAKYDNVNNSYIQFEYNGYKYTTVAYNGNLSDETSSKAKENAPARTDLDNKFDKVENRAVYDGNSAIISGLPNTSITDANYASQFAVSASTGNIVSGLLNTAETNSWVSKKTFCSNHCTAGSQEHEIATIPITREYGNAYYHTDYWEDRDGDPTNGDEYHVQEDYKKDTATVNVHIYCYGAPKFDDDPHGIITAADRAQYSRAPLGNEFNNYSGVHYYAADEIDGPTTRDCKSSVEGIYIWDIKNMNLGLVRREQPDAALVSDIEKVRVIMKNQEYTYIYGNRGIGNTDALIDYKVKWQNEYNVQQYSRPVNPADIAYVNDTGTDDLKVYVTYNIVAKNESTTLSMTINNIVNYYDSNYTIYTGAETATSSGWTEGSGTNNGYKIAYNNSLSGTKLAPGESSNIIKIEFEVSQTAIKGLLNENATLQNTSEIYSFTTWYGANTMCAEQETAATKGKTGGQYAGLDTDSTPGSAIPGNLGTYEDDTDRAPSFLLVKDPNYKIVSGTVYEDTDKVTTDNERLGDGTKADSEKGVENVKVELLKVNDDGSTTLAQIYTAENGTTTKKDAVTYTDTNGNYSFGNNGDNQSNRAGVVVDNYVIRYTYGNADKQTGYETGFASSDMKTIGSTKINGNEINARNYKSTIITTEPIKGVVAGTNTSDKWHLTMQDNASVAVDGLYDSFTERLAIPSLQYSNYNAPVNMSSYTRPFKLQTEYTENQTANVGTDGKNENFKYDLTTFDFGIIERPRENIVIEKTIAKIKITLANGQVLIEGDPRKEEKITYTKAIGFSPVDSRETTLSVTDKLLSMEMDTELIQGSKLEIWYAITVTNNSEIDYEFDSNAGGNEKYYYYGENPTHPIKSSVELVVDYMDQELICEVGEDAPAITEMNENNNLWTKKINTDTITSDVLKANGYISANAEGDTSGYKTYESLKDGNYQIFLTDMFKNVAPGESLQSILYASRLLSVSSDSLSYDNHVEILRINGKIARTIDSVDDNSREQIVKQYKPGTYIPSEERIIATKIGDYTVNGVSHYQVVDGTLEGVGLHNQDDDMVRIVITPPTGLANNIITYIAIGAVALIVLVGGIYFIKKRVINK